MRKLGSGIYLSADATVHFDPREMCDAHGVPHTPENEAIALTAAEKIVAQYWPGVELEVESSDADPS